MQEQKTRDREREREERKRKREMESERKEREVEKRTSPEGCKIEVNRRDEKSKKDMLIMGIMSKANNICQPRSVEAVS